MENAAEKQPSRMHVVVMKGKFNWAQPQDVEVQVLLHRPGQRPTSLIVPWEGGEELFVRRDEVAWPDLLTTALQLRRQRYVGGDTELELQEWLAVDENWDALADAWARARRDRLARELRRVQRELDKHCDVWHLSKEVGE